MENHSVGGAHSSGDVLKKKKRKEKHFPRGRVTGGRVTGLVLLLIE
jgi:hypothetical protein